MRYVESILDIVGNTPVVTLNHVSQGIEATVLAKVEYLNPGSSIKDGTTKMIGAAEEQGLLRAGGTIVEPTSGTTGMGLAMVAQQRGDHCIFVCPDRVGLEKCDLLGAYAGPGPMRRDASPSSGRLVGRAGDRGTCHSRRDDVVAMGFKRGAGGLLTCAF